jgi:hypothetical protein
MLFSCELGMNQNDGTAVAKLRPASTSRDEIFFSRPAVCPWRAFAVSGAGLRNFGRIGRRVIPASSSCRTRGLGVVGSEIAGDRARLTGAARQGAGPATATPAPRAARLSFHVNFFVRFTLLAS